MSHLTGAPVLCQIIVILNKVFFVFLIVTFLIRTCLIICLIHSSNHSMWVENGNLVFLKPVLSINLLYLKANFFFLISWVARHVVVVFNSFQVSERHWSWVPLWPWNLTMFLQLVLCTVGSLSVIQSVKDWKYCKIPWSSKKQFEFAAHQQLFT